MFARNDTLVIKVVWNAVIVVLATVVVVTLVAITLPGTVRVVVTLGTVQFV